VQHHEHGPHDEERAAGGQGQAAEPVISRARGARLGFPAADPDHPPIMPESQGLQSIGGWPELPPRVDSVKAARIRSRGGSTWT
jgi:hypothetical protein